MIVAQPGAARRSTAAASSAPRASSTAIAVASAQPVPRGFAPGDVRVRQRRAPSAVTSTSVAIVSASPRWPPLTSTARSPVRAISAPPRRLGLRAGLDRCPASAAASVAFGVTSVARRSSGSSSAGAPSHSGPPREVASTGSTTTGPA